MNTNDKLSNEVLLYKERGGWRIGYGFWGGPNATWPLVKLELYSDKLVMIGLFCKKVELRKSEILNITPYSGFLSSGVRICHNNSSVMPFIVFWSRSVHALLTQMEKAGYPVIR